MSILDRTPFANLPPVPHRSLRLTTLLLISTLTLTASLRAGDLGEFEKPATKKEDASPKGSSQALSQIDRLSDQIEKCPNEQLLVGRGRLYLSKNRTQEAIDDFERAGTLIKKGRGQPQPPLRDLALAYFQLGAREKGLELLRCAWNMGDIEALAELRRQNIPYHTRWTPFSFDLVYPGIPYPPDEWHVRGLAIGLANRSASVWGIQMAPLDVQANEARGIQVGFDSIADRFYGIQLGLVGAAAGGRPYHPWPTYDDETGLSAGFQLGGILVFAGNFWGVQAAAIVGAEDLRGVQLALFSAADTVNGIQLGGWNYADKTLRGLQVGVVNRTGSLKIQEGVQVGAVNRCSGELHGLQVGVYNDAGKLQGVQIGLLNRIRQGSRLAQFVPIVNAAW